MLRKIGSNIRRKQGGVSSSVKCRFDVSLDSLDGLPSKVSRCRIQFERSPKVQMSSMQDCSNGVPPLRRDSVGAPESLAEPFRDSRCTLVRLSIGVLCVAIHQIRVRREDTMFHPCRCPCRIADLWQRPRYATSKLQARQVNRGCPLLVPPR